MVVNDLTVKWFYSKVDAVIDNRLTSDKIQCVIENDTNPIGVGVSLCSPNDTYDKEFGRKLALTRAVAASELPWKVRASIWEAYRNMTKVPRW